MFSDLYDFLKDDPCAIYKDEESNTSLTLKTQNGRSRLSQVGLRKVYLTRKIVRKFIS